MQVDGKRSAKKTHTKNENEMWINKVLLGVGCGLIIGVLAGVLVGMQGSGKAADANVDLPQGTEEKELIESLLEQCEDQEQEAKSWCKDPDQIYREIKHMKKRQDLKKLITGVMEERTIEWVVSKTVREQANRVQSRIDMFDDLTTSICEVESKVMELVNQTEEKVGVISEMREFDVSLREEITNLEMNLTMLQKAITDSKRYDECCTSCQESWYQYVKTVFRMIQYCAITAFITVILAEANKPPDPVILFWFLMIPVPFIIWFY